MTLCTTAFTAVTSYQHPWQLLRDAKSFDSCHKLSQLWHLLQVVASLDFCYKLLAAFKAVGRFDSWYMLSSYLTVFTSCQQLWQLLQANTIFDSCFKLSAANCFRSYQNLSSALRAFTKSKLLEYLIPSAVVSSFILQQGRDLVSQLCQLCTHTMPNLQSSNEM